LLHQGAFCPLAPLTQCFVHGGGSGAVHAWQDVGVGVEGERDAGVSQELLDVLGVDVTGKEQGGEGVPEVVDTRTLRQLGVPTVEEKTRPWSRHDERECRRADSNRCQQPSSSRSRVS
jgi:hypothetical protein